MLSEARSIFIALATNLAHFTTQNLGVELAVSLVFSQIK
jgi:hypothetical protein